MSEGVSTEMDQLMELLEDVNAIKVSDAADELGVDKGLIENWAKMLEKAEAVEVHYSVIGGAVLKKGKKFEQVWGKAAKKEESPKNEPREETKSKEEPVKEKVEPAKKAEEGRKGSEEKSFPLIRTDLEESSKEIKGEIERIREEEKRVIEYMDALVAEGQKLSKKLDDMAAVAEKMKKEKAKPMGS